MKETKSKNFKRFFVNQRNYNEQFHKNRYEENKGKSETIPNMAMPMDEIMRRYVRGAVLPTKDPVFLGEEEFPDLENMDAIEKNEVIGELAQEMLEQLRDLEQPPISDEEEEIEEVKPKKRGRPKKAETEQKESNADDD